MINTSGKNVYDVIIVGAGLSGLCAGLELQRSGLKVGVIERLSRPGGLCGTQTYDNYEFVIACNDFGSGIERLFKYYRIKQKFYYPKMMVFYKGESYIQPLNLVEMIKGWRYTLQVLKYFLKGLFPFFRKKEEHYLQGLVDNTVYNKTLNDMLKLPAYLMGVKPSELKVDMLREDLKYRYGYLNPTTPYGGPQVMVDNMVKVFKENGDIFLDTEFVEINSEDRLRKIVTTKGNFYTKDVIFATGEAKPESSKTGLPVSTFCIVIDESYRYPKDIHTIVHYPPDPEKWFGMLDSGLKPDDFGFHIFSSDLPEKKGYYTANIYFYLPRGLLAPSSVEVDVYEKYIFSKLEEMLPGINDSILYKRFISPDQFEKTHQLSSRVMPVVTPVAIEKMKNYNPVENIYAAGNTFYPPGDHAGAALLSGVTAAKELKKNIA